MRSFHLPVLAAACCLVLAACVAPVREIRPVAVGVADVSLPGKDWRLVAAPDGRRLPTDGAGATLLRFEPTRFSMSGPCNSHTGVWSQEGGRLAMGGEGGVVVSTRRACPGELMTRETQLLSAFRQPLRMEVRGTRLELMAADGTRWTFDSRDIPTSAGRERIVLVSGERRPCTGVAGAQCLQVRTEPGAPWQDYHGEIEGFRWQQGVDFVLRVREYTPANARADGSSRRWVLEEILDRSQP